uniref:Uncharacterized protein n=1 Tax=Rhizophora mucronata TaxID=61149 RepID=A0A2P2NTQ6_RHIMU
MFLGVCDLT